MMIPISSSSSTASVGFVIAFIRFKFGSKATFNIKFLVIASEMLVI